MRVLILLVFSFALSAQAASEKGSQCSNQVNLELNKLGLAKGFNQTAAGWVRTEHSWNNDNLRNISLGHEAKKRELYAMSGAEECKKPIVDMVDHVNKCLHPYYDALDKLDEQSAEFKSKQNDVTKFELRDDYKLSQSVIWDEALSQMKFDKVVSFVTDATPKTKAFVFLKNGRPVGFKNGDGENGDYTVMTLNDECRISDFRGGMTINTDKPDSYRAAGFGLNEKICRDLPKAKNKITRAELLLANPARSFDKLCRKTGGWVTTKTEHCLCLTPKASAKNNGLGWYDPNEELCVGAVSGKQKILKRSEKNVDKWFRNRGEFFGNYGLPSTLVFEKMTAACALHGDALMPSANTETSKSAPDGKAR